MSIKYVLDSSALLAVLHRERGHEMVESVLNDASMSAVNACEVIGKLLAIPMELEAAIEIMRLTGVEIVSFDHSLACEAAALQTLTKPLGLSLGDRACLALARRHSLAVLTTDRAWKKLPAKLAIEVRVVR